MTRTFFLLATLVGLLCVVPAVVSYGTIFVDNVVPVKATETYVNATISKLMEASTGQVGKINARNRGGFSVDTPGPITVTSGDSISLQAAANIRLGTDDPDFSGVTLTAGDASFKSTHMIIDTNTATLQADNDISFISDAEALIQAKNFLFESEGDVTFDSAHGNVFFQSTQDVSIVSSDFDFETTGDMLFQSGLGNILFNGDSISSTSTSLRVNSREDTVLFSADSATFTAGAHVRMQSAGAVKLNAQGDLSIDSSLGDILVRASTTASIQGQDDVEFSANNGITLMTTGDSESDIRFNAANNLSFNSNSGSINFASSKADFDFISGEDFVFDSTNILFDQVKESIELVSSIITLNPQVLTLQTTDRALSVSSYDDVQFIAGQRILTSSDNGPLSFISVNDFSIRTPNTVTVSADNTITIKKDNAAIAGNLEFRGLNALTFQANTIDVNAGRMAFTLNTASFTATDTLSLITPANTDSSFKASVSASVDANRDIQGLSNNLVLQSGSILTVLPTTSLAFFTADLADMYFAGTTVTLGANNTDASFTGGNVYYSAVDVTFDNTLNGIFYNADNINLDADSSTVTTTFFTFDASASVDAIVQADLSFVSTGSMSYVGGSGVLSIVSPDILLNAINVNFVADKIEFAALTRDDSFTFNSVNSVHTTRSDIFFDSEGDIKLTTSVVDLDSGNDINFRGEDSVTISTTTISFDTDLTTITSPGEAVLTTPDLTINADTSSFTAAGTVFVSATHDFTSVSSDTTTITSADTFDVLSSVQSTLDTDTVTVSAKGDALLQSSGVVNLLSDSFTTEGNQVQIASYYNGDIEINADDLVTFDATSAGQFIRLSAAGSVFVDSNTFSATAVDHDFETDDFGDIQYTGNNNFNLGADFLFVKANHDLTYQSQGTIQIDTQTLITKTDNSITFDVASIADISASTGIEFLSSSYTTFQSASILATLGSNFVARAGDLLEVEADSILLSTAVDSAYITVAADDGIVTFEADQALTFTTSDVGSPAYTGDINIFAAGDTETRGNSIQISSTGEIGPVGTSNPAILIQTEGQRGNIVFHALNGNILSTAPQSFSLTAVDGFFSTRAGPGSFTSHILTMISEGFNLNSDSSGTIQATTSITVGAANIYHDSMTGIQTTIDDGSLFSFDAGRKFIVESGGGESTSITSAAGFSLTSSEKTMIHAGTSMQVTTLDSETVNLSSGGNFYINSNSNPASFTLTTESFDITNQLFNIQSGGDVSIDTQVGDFGVTTGNLFTVFAERGPAYITAGNNATFEAATNIRISAEGDRDVPRDGVHFSGTSIKSTNPTATTSLFASNFVELGSGLFRPSILFNSTGNPQTPGFVLESEGDVLLENGGAFTTTADSFQVQTSRQATFTSDDEIDFSTTSIDNGFITIESNTGDVRIKADNSATIRSTDQLKFIGNSLRLSSGTPLPSGDLSFVSGASIVSSSQNINWNVGNLVSNSLDQLWNARQSLSIVGNANDGGDMTFLSTLGGINMITGTTMDFRTTGLEADLNVGTQNTDSPLNIVTKATNSPISFQSVGPFESYAALATNIQSTKSSITITSGNNDKLNGLFSDVTFIAATDIIINGDDDVVFSSTKGARAVIGGNLSGASASLLISAGTDLTFHNNDLADTQNADIFSLTASVDLLVQTNVGGGGNIIIQALDTETPNVSPYSITMNLAQSPSHAVTGTVGGNFIGAGGSFSFSSTGIDPAGGDFGVRFETEGSADLVMDSSTTTSINADETINAFNKASTADIQFNTTTTTTANVGDLLMQTRNSQGDIRVVSEFGNVVLSGNENIAVDSSTIRFQASGTVGSLDPLAYGTADQSIVFDSKTFVSLTSPKVSGTADNYFRVTSIGALNTAGTPSTDVFIGDVDAFSKSSTTSASSVLFRTTGPDTNINIETLLLNVGGAYTDTVNTRLAAVGEATGNFRFRSAKTIKIFSEFNQFYTVYDDKAGIEISTSRNATDADIIIRGTEVRFEAEKGMEFATRSSQGSHFVMISKVGANIFQQLEPNLPVGISLQAHNGKFSAIGGDDGDIVVHAGRDLSVLAEGGIKFISASATMDAGNAVLQTLDGSFDLSAKVINLIAAGNMDVVADNLLEFDVPSPNGPAAVFFNAPFINIASNEQSYTVSGGNILFNGVVDLSDSAFLLPSHGLLVRSANTVCRREGQIIYNAATVLPTRATSLAGEIAHSYPRLCRCTLFVWNCVDFFDLAL